jgi:hypothetical protein
MANIPGIFTGTLPGIYGPVSYPVKKIEGGYYINGYGAELRGTCRQIAQQILLKLVNEPERFEDRKNYVGPFYIELKPKVRVILCMDAVTDPSDLDLVIVSDEITKEFESLVKLIPFS